MDSDRRLTVISVTFVAFALLTKSMVAARSDSTLLAVSAAADPISVAPSFATQPVSQYANIGDQVTLQCDAQWSPEAAASSSANRDATVQWIKDGALLHAHSNAARITFKRHAMELRVKSESDFGKYQCLVSLGDSGSLLSHFAYVLRAPWRPSKYQDPNATLLSVPLGNVAIIPCGDVLHQLQQTIALNGYDFQYDFANTTLPIDDQHFLTSSGNLLMVMKSSRVGIYRCRVFGPTPSRAVVFQKFFDLRLQPSDHRSPARLSHISPSHVVARRDESVTLECVYHGSPVPSNRWEIYEYERDENRPRIIGDSDRKLRFGSLHITNVSILDQGRYVCLGDNTGKGTHNMPANRVINMRVIDRLQQPRMTVAGDATVESASSNPNRVNFVRVNDAGVLSLSCEVNVTGGNMSSATHLVWLLNGNSSLNGIVSEETRTHAGDAANTVTINSSIFITRFVRSMHQGVYQCLLESASTYESAYAAAIVSVVANSGPTLIASRPRNATVGYGEAVVFLCSVNTAAVGEDLVQVTWLRDSVVIDSCDNCPDCRICEQVMRNSEHVLHIYMAQYEDAGKYTCAVELPNRLDSADVWLTLEPEPAAETDSISISNAPSNRDPTAQANARRNQSASTSSGSSSSTYVDLPNQRAMLTDHLTTAVKRTTSANAPVNQLTQSVSISAARFVTRSTKSPLTFAPRIPLGSTVNNNYRASTFSAVRSSSLYKNNENSGEDVGHEENSASVAVSVSSHPLKSLTDKPVYLITLIAGGTALFLCLLIVFVVLYRKQKRRQSGKPVTSSSFSKQLNLAPADVVYNKLSSQSEGAGACIGFDNCNFGVQPCVYIQQLAPYQLNATPINVATGVYQGVDMRNENQLDQIADGSLFARQCDTGYANVHQTLSGAHQVYTPSRSVVDDDESCSDDDCSDDVSPSKRFRYSSDNNSNDLNQIVVYACLPTELEQRNTLNRNKLIALRKQNAANTNANSNANLHRFSAVYHSARENPINHVLAGDVYSRNIAVL